MTENKWSRFISVRLIEGKPKKVIVDICGDIININPIKKELLGLKKEEDVKISRGHCNLSGEELKEYLLEFLRYFYYKEGRIPKKTDFQNNPKYPSSDIYYRVFGSWSNAIREAGLAPYYNMTDEEVLNYLIQFYEINGRPPSENDFKYDPRYPSFGTYVNRFGSWQRALKLTGLDTDSLVKKGIIDTEIQKGRLGELFIKDHYDEIGAIDLSGMNCLSHYDGICPDGYRYDVKCSHLRKTHWAFHINNSYIEEIEYYYLIAFNDDWTDLLYAWRIPSSDFLKDFDKGYIYVGINSNWEYNVENMNKYLITKKVRPIFEKWLNNIKNQDNSKEVIVRESRILLQKYVETKKQKIGYDKRYYDGYFLIKENVETVE